MQKILAHNTCHLGRAQKPACCVLLLGILAWVLPTAFSATEAYDTQTGNMNSLQVEKNDSPPSAGTVNNGSELKQYANNGEFGNTPGAAAFRTLTTDGTDETASTRALQIGDLFTITCYIAGNPSAGGRVGISFRDSTTYSDFFASTDSATEARFQLDDSGNWKVYHDGGSTASGSAAGADRTVTIKPTSETTFNATVAGTTYYDLVMDASGGLIDSFAIYTFGDENSDSFWKSASLQDSGTIEIGGGGGSSTISGKITDGYQADSSSIVRTNALYKLGTGTLTLSATNTYSGGTYIEEGVLAVDATGTVGSGAIEIGKASEADTSELQLNDTNGGKTVTNAITILDAATAQRTIASTATSGTNTVSGDITHNYSVNNLRLYQVAGGTLALSGAVSGQGSLWVDDLADGTFRLSASNSFSGGVYFDGSTLDIAHAHALGSGKLEVGPDSGFARDATVEVNSGSMTITNTVDVNDQPGVYGVYIRNNGSGAVTYSGTWTINRGLDLENPGGGSLTLSGPVTLSGGTHDIWITNGNVAISGNVGGSVGMTKKGDDQLTLSGNNTFSGTTTVSAGTLLYSGTNTTSAVSVSDGAVLRGEGSIGALTVNSNAVVAAGAAASDVGTLTMTAMNLETGGSNVVEIVDAETGAGAGWDLLSAGGALTVNATSDNPFVIAIDDVGLSNFTNTNTYAWVIIEGGSISGFGANKFSVDTNAFGLATDGGTFSVGTNETDDLVLNYTPPASGPILAVAPVTMTFSARRGQDPAVTDDTFVVSNVNQGTLLFTNTVAYGAGASGWLAIAPSTGSVAAASGVTVTGTVASSSSLARGTYYATNTVSAGDAGTSNVVVTLSVTGYTGVVSYEPVSGDDGYANTEVLHGKTGGEGWGANAWTRNAQSPEVYIETGALDSFTDYCDDGALKARVNMDEATSGDRFRECYRSFDALTSGMVYVAYTVKMEKDNAGNIGGVKLMDGANDKIWVGKIDAASKGLAIRHDGTSYEIGSYEITAGNTFLIVGRFDFGSQEFSAKAYTPAQFISVDEPSPSGWEVSATMATPITSINRVSLVAERPLVDEDARGYVMWDDVRVATRWADLICGATVVQGVVTATNATFSALEVGDKVSDQVLNSGAFPVSLDLYDANVPIYVGTEGGGFFKPDFDLLNGSGGAIVTDLDFASLVASDGGKAVTASHSTLSSMTSSNIPIGTVTMQWSAIDSNKAYRVNVPELEDGTDLDFTVYDDDTAGPSASILYVGASYTPGGGVQTNITDADLANTNEYFDVAVQWTDPSGVFMTNSTIANQTNIGSEKGRVIPNFDLYITNVTLNTEAQYEVDRVFTNFLGANGNTTVTTVYYNAFAITNSHEDDTYYLTLSAEDEDNDRGAEPDTTDEGGGIGDDMPFDRMVTTNQFVPFTVTDNDAVAPVISAVAVAGDASGDTNVLASELVSGEWSITGRVQDVTSGVNVNGSQTTGEDISPYVVLIDPLGVPQLTNVFDSLSFSDGGATNVAGDLSHQTPSGMSGAYAMTGVWTARVVVADNDEHRTGDRTLGTNSVTFSVPVDGDGDDLNDGWEMAYLDDLTPDGTGDKDGDGVLDEDEYLSGTDPDSTNSRLRLVSADLETESSDNLDLTFEGGGFIEPGGYAGVDVSETRSFKIRYSDTYGGTKALLGYRNGSLSATNVYTDTNAVTETATRFYEISVTYGGKSYTNAREWAMHVQPREQDRHYLVTVPVDYVYGSNALDSTLGQQIARGLTPGDAHNEPGADQIQFDDGLSFSTYTFVTNGAGETEWWDGSGKSSRVVTPGEGFWVLRGNGTVARTNMVFVGLTRTSNVSQVGITVNNESQGWDAQIFGWPYSVARPTSGPTKDPFNFVTGGAYGGARGGSTMKHDQHGDQIWYLYDDNGTGKWRYIWLVDTGGARADLDDTWWDSNANPPTNAVFSLEPGKAYYYRHHVEMTNGTPTGEAFNWQPKLVP